MSAGDDHRPSIRVLDDGTLQGSCSCGWVSEKRWTDDSEGEGAAMSNALAHRGGITSEPVPFERGER